MFIIYDHIGLQVQQGTTTSLGNIVDKIRIRLGYLRWDRPRLDGDAISRL